MKKIVWISILLLCLLLVACSSNDSSKQDDNQEATNNENEQVVENQDQDESQGSEDEDKADTDQQIDDETSKEAPEGAEEPIEAKYKVSDVWSIVPLDENTNEKVVLLTIDDAPDTYALEMAKTLKSLNVNAIFFVNGIYLTTPEKEDVLKQIHDMGFLIGNHTYSHPYLPDLSEEEQREEIVKVNDMVENIIGIRPKFFRAPNGANTDFTKQLAKKEGMVLMNWSYGYDWHKEYSTKEAITDIMLNTPYLGNGSTLLMHDREWTNAALKDIVKGLRDKGYEFVDPKLIQTLRY